MRKVGQTTMKSPNYEKRDDLKLRECIPGAGPPDMMLIVEGVKLYVHSKVLLTYSKVMEEKIRKPDAFYGKQIQMIGRSKQDVIALLNAIYPPQMVPPPECFNQVYEIAQFYEMTLLIEKLKLGIVKNCSLEPLEAAERAGKEPAVVFDAYSEFTNDEIKKLPGYADLQTKTKLSVARRRVELLEKNIAKKGLSQDAKYMNLFRKCHEEEREEEAQVKFQLGGSSKESALEATISLGQSLRSGRSQASGL